MSPWVMVATEPPAICLGRNGERKSVKKPVGMESTIILQCLDHFKQHRFAIECRLNGD